MSQQRSTAAYSAAARLERLPISGYHRVIFIIIAGAFFFDSIDLGMMTFVLGSIKQEFGLSTAQAGLLASSSFLGMAAGAALSGLLADRFGRKPVFQVSMIIWGVASYLCSTAASAQELIFYRVLLGLGMGMEFPIAQTILSEFTPTRQRGRYIALMDGFWPLGFITAGLIAYYLLSVADWRTVFVVLAIPAAFLLVVRRYVPESPRWLEHAGRHDEAERVLSDIEAKVSRSLGVRTLPEPVEIHAAAPESAARWARCSRRSTAAAPSWCGACGSSRCWVLRVDHLAGGAAAAGRLRRDQVRDVHGADLAGRHSRLSLRRLAGREMGA